MELVSPCLAPEQSCPWQHGEVVYTVRGQKEGEPIYDACRTKVEKVLYRRVQPAPETRDLDFYAFSFYYDLAVDLQLIGQPQPHPHTDLTPTLHQHLTSPSASSSPSPSPHLPLTSPYFQSAPHLTLIVTLTLTSPSSSPSPHLSLPLTSPNEPVNS